MPNGLLSNALAKVEQYALPARRGLLNMFSPEEAYAKLAGEAESRATQARMPLNAEQRRATFPADSYDVPLNQLIFR